MKKYSVFLLIVIIVTLVASFMYETLINMAGGYDARYQYLKISMKNFAKNEYNIELYKNDEQKDFKMPIEYGINVYDENNEEIMRKLAENEIRYYSSYNAIEGEENPDYTDTVKVEITQNNGEVFIKEFNYEFDENVYYAYEFDCETGMLIEKEVDESDMPHTYPTALRNSINNAIRAVYYGILGMAVLYVLFYLYKLMTSFKK